MKEAIQFLGTESLVVDDIDQLTSEDGVSMNLTSCLRPLYSLLRSGGTCSVFPEKRGAL